jgi:hypothetical protein
MAIQTAYQNRSLSLGIPYLDGSRVTANQKYTGRLLPVHYDASTLTDIDQFREPPERANHLDRALVHRRIVIPIEANDAIS